MSFEIDALWMNLRNKLIALSEQDPRAPAGFFKYLLVLLAPLKAGSKHPIARFNHYKHSDESLKKLSYAPNSDSPPNRGWAISFPLA
jgi:hypothetical protein